MLKIKPIYADGFAGYSADGFFLEKNILIRLEDLNDDTLLKSLDNLNLANLIKSYMIEISIGQSLLDEQYIYKIRCFGNKRYWSSDNLIKSCLMAIVYWFNNSKYIEIQQPNKLPMQRQEYDVFIESLNLPLSLYIQLKALNVKTVKDFNKITDLGIIAELKKLNLF